MTEETAGREIKLVVFKIGDEEFAVEVGQVREIIKMTEITKMPKAPFFVEGIINLRGQIIAVIDLSKRMDIGESSKDAESRIVVIETNEMKVGMIVDSVSEVIPIDESIIEPNPAIAVSDVDMQFIKGVVKIESRLLILLDLSRILTQGEIAELSGF